MINFENSVYVKLATMSNEDANELVAPMLITDESVFAAFKTVRDQIVFTNRRVIAINFQGLTGKKKDFTSLPYSKVQAFSVETAGVIDFDTSMELWFPAMGKVRFEFKANFDVKSFNKLIGHYIL